MNRKYCISQPEKAEYCPYEFKLETSLDAFKKLIKKLQSENSPVGR